MADSFSTFITDFADPQKFHCLFDKIDKLNEGSETVSPLKETIF